MSGWLRTRIGLGLLSIAGTTAGHYLSYWFVAPDAHHREDLLHSTGHAGESPFVILAIAAFLATCIAILGGRSATRHWSVARVFPLLAAMQVSAFVLLEAAERLSEGTPLVEAAREPVVALGLGVQLIVAFAGAFILRLLHRAASVTPRIQPRLAGATVLPAIDGTVVLYSRFEKRAWEARGPPRSS